MPRVKIDYVVSFSSEDSDNPASNLLAWEISKKKWLCAKGEPSCSVVLQLPRAVQISQVDIGAYDTALVEVLVGRSERPNDPFEVLVPRCVLLSPAESRAGGGAARVRSFAGPALGEARARRWDRVRVVCSQPYNRHCQYGLSFVHIFEPEATGPAGQPGRDAGTAGRDAGQPGRDAGTAGRDAGQAGRDAGQAGRDAGPAGRDVLSLAADDDDDDDFRPGELFAQHRAHAAATTTAITTTATTTTATTTTTTTTGAGTDAQIRRVTSRAFKNMEDSSTKIVKAPIPKIRGGDKIRNEEKREANSDERRRGPAYSEDERPRVDDPGREHRKGGRDGAGMNKEAEERTGGEGPVEDAAVRAGKRKRGDEREESLASRRRVALRGAVVALSGFQHPERGRLRELALAMGARYDRDAGPRTTHLVCAFPNTPRLRALRAANGARAAVGAGWLRACWQRGRRLPWRPHAADPAERRPDGGDDDEDDGGGAPECDEECDTDDEIEKVLREKRQRASSPRGDDDDNDDGALTEAESPPRAASPRGPLPALPAPLAGRVLAVDAALPGCDRDRLVRYIRAYGGHVPQDGAEAAECVVTSRARGPRSPPHVPPRRLLALMAAQTAVTRP